VREVSEPHTPLGRLSPVRSLFFSLPPDLLFHCSRELASAKFGRFGGLSEARNFIVTVV